MKAVFVANAAISEKRFLFTKKLFAFTMEIYELIEKKLEKNLQRNAEAWERISILREKTRRMVLLRKFKMKIEAFARKLFNLATFIQNLPPLPKITYYPFGAGGLHRKFGLPDEVAVEDVLQYEAVVDQDRMARQCITGRTSRQNSGWYRTSLHF